MNKPYGFPVAQLLQKRVLANQKWVMLIMVLETDRLKYVSSNYLRVGRIAEDTGGGFIHSKKITPTGRKHLTRSQRVFIGWYWQTRRRVTATYRFRFYFTTPEAIDPNLLNAMSSGPVDGGGGVSLMADSNAPGFWRKAWVCGTCPAMSRITNYRVQTYPSILPEGMESSDGGSLRGSVRVMAVWEELG
jgi:hypothetical protein